MTARSAWVMAAALILSGCGRREITSIERAQAAADVSEADFAVTIHEYDRAEGLYATAAGLTPDNGHTWVNLAMVRMRLHKPSEARSAYKSALSAYRRDFKRDAADKTPLLREAYILVILGRADEARSLIADMRATYPDDRILQGFADGKGLEQIEKDPGLKDISP